MKVKETVTNLERAGQAANLIRHGKVSKPDYSVSVFDRNVPLPNNCQKSVADRLLNDKEKILVREMSLHKLAAGHWGLMQVSRHYDA